MMKVMAIALLIAVVLPSCSTNHGRTRQMYPDCTPAEPGEKCMYRNT